MDINSIAMKSPWSLFNAAEYDMQGLSDWAVPELPKPGDPMEEPCDLYWMVPWDPSPLKHIVFSKWDLPQGKDTTKLLIYNPCQSTGLWTVEPTVASVSALRHMNARLASSSTMTQWEQAMWNELVMTHLWGSDVEPPLRYRLLPHDTAASVKVWEARRAQGLPADLVVLRAGHLDGTRKGDAYERLGVWHPDYSRRENPLNFPSQATLLRAPSPGAKGIPTEGSWQNLAVSVVPTVQSLNAEAFILLGGLAVVAVIVVTLLQRRGRRASSA
ncbi:hypothetical protein H632_c35p2 [Helicosporidium sp. ATCC 50920]|nr:hypothetical protein H632_c35p2 [Helicosporidium sp. ATCC 50920]|eukprot:KDD77034.1 hypothetical protein H632_c35p2 [Helicosporidium sp. ATCC 50920]